MELARSLGTLVRGGFRPKRTIVLASWDAEEFTLTSSTEWGEQYAEELRQPRDRLHQRGQCGIGTGVHCRPRCRR